MIIDVKNVCRSFKSLKKEEGIRGTLNLLLKPKYETHEALKGITFGLESGSFTGLIGTNGAGKTTLLKILSGLIPPSSGEARVLGFEPFKRPLAFRQKIALVMGQKAQLWWDLPAKDAFDLLKAIYEIPKKIYLERLHTLSTLLNVNQHLQTQIRRLSLGERMKMELIGAILHWPSVIFLDEPTIGLDVLAASKLREFLKFFNAQEKATIILTSHNMDDIERLCSRVLMIRAGQLIYDGEPSKLIQKGEMRLRIRFLENPSLEELSKITSLPIHCIEEKSEENDKEKFSSENQPIYFSLKQEQRVPILQTLLKHYSIIDIRFEEQSLEKVIQRIYESDSERTHL